ncbi:MAG: radical SAM protein [Nitrososphaeria archaeon]|nr:radical SAM protein [Nitrososphaeria archaeon]
MKIIQIEVSSRCNADCLMCPKSSYKDLWSFGDMDLEDYTKISSCFDECDIVWLQGWGEPLLSKNIYEMVRLAGRRDTTVGLTTNAMLLNSERSRRLIENGVKVLSISIAGGTRETHESIRRGTSFNKIIENVKALTQLRRNVNARDLKVIFTFLRIKQNIAELPRVVELASELDVDQVIGTNIDYIPTKEHYDMKIFSEGKASKEYLEIIRSSEERARELGVSIFNYPIEMEEVIVCPEDPTRGLFISHDGSVSPCVYLNVPLRSHTIPRYFKNTQYDVPKLIYGNIKVERLEEIWRKKEYMEFRDVYNERVKSSKPTVSFIQSLLEVREVHGIPQIPEPCRTCYKAYGV